jgi:thiol-disulfide isomerase/thioredoxin
MKRIPCFIALSSFIFAVGCSGEKETVITGHIVGKSGVKFLEYTPPMSGTSYTGFRDTIFLDEEGNFELKLAMDKPAFITVSDRDPYLPVKLLVEPGNSYHIDMDVSRKNTQISGANEKGQMLYASLPDPSYIEMEAEKLMPDSSLASIHGKVEEMKQSDLSKFRELLDNREISKSFFNLAKADRDCYYASLEASISFGKAPRVFETKQFVLPNGENLLENLTKIYTQYPPNDKRLLFSTFWREYAKLYVKGYKQIIREDLDREKILELYLQNRINTLWIDESKKYLTGRALEFFQATLIYYAGLQKNYEKELITLFEQFTKDYPDSEYSKYIKPEIDQIVQYYQAIEEPFDETVHFVDGYENITTLEEAIKPFKGKKVYIDIWATWCGPCKREFAHQQALKKILEEQDIQSLYISIDENDRDQQWKEAIKFYGLSGAHIRAGRPLFEELCERYSKKNKYVNIPWYILVDENGKILKKHAEVPSEIVERGLSMQ